MYSSRRASRFAHSQMPRDTISYTIAPSMLEVEGGVLTTDKGPPIFLRPTILGHLQPTVALDLYQVISPPSGRPVSRCLSNLCDKQFSFAWSCSTIDAGVDFLQYVLELGRIHEMQLAYSAISLRHSNVYIMKF
ncbi:hypothetical protein EVAR_43975_1 [Eumeta japonica]|uniref:Uncharacterized protein n=1 Tax=Eumeta variegata TaxID=151549 RepID=A0A4C1XH18_EUMVA|nr:hypothetical protein EVAR_43975_1 [Eumeta japonica]